MNAQPPPLPPPLPPPPAPKKAPVVVRVFCILFLGVQVAQLMARFDEVQSIAEAGMALLFCGAIPAVWLMAPTRATNTTDTLLRGLAIVGLYAVFTPCLHLSIYCLSHTHMGALMLLCSAVAHSIWLLVALPCLHRSSAFDRAA